MHNHLPQHELVLLGVGHTNAHILKMWRMQPLPGARLTCLSNFPVATYSGMLPGTLAGQYQPSDMQIDLVRLCAAAGARLLFNSVTGLDVERQLMLFDDRPPLPFDALSIGIGSRPTDIPGEDIHVLPIKPMQTFLQRLESRLASLARHVNDRPWQIAVVGAGAGGFEIACCLNRHVSRQFPSAKVKISLVDHGTEILTSMPRRTRALARQELARQDIDLILGRKINHIDGEGRLQLADGSELPADLILWATSARAPELLDHLNLEQDERGFLLTRPTLQTATSEAIFAVGDTGTLADQPLTKAGVYAVRQGPILWENLQRLLANRPLQTWQPQRSFLTLLNTGNDRAILTYKGMSVHAQWCWWLKDTIDRRFMAMYQDYQPSMAAPAPTASTDVMYCGGCGCKLPSDVLTRVLSQLDNPPTSDVLVGLDQADDVAVLASHASDNTAITTDFFTAFLDDPHLLGKIAAQNALSDFYASGVTPQAALALVTIPHGPAQRQEQFLLEVLDGALQVLRPAGAPIVGGHTIEGEQATVGFTLVGRSHPAGLLSKRGLQVGDQFVLTKPLGTGILLAAHQQAKCRAEWFDPLITSMRTSNQNAATIAQQFGATALTDVTGFGLAGHLYEMLEASQVSANISLASLPLLPGAAELAQQGIESTLAPGNRQAERHVTTLDSLRNNPRYSLLFDPQTSGGLLMGIAPAKVSELLDRLGNAAVVIGEVAEREGLSVIQIDD